MLRWFFYLVVLRFEVVQRPDKTMREKYITCSIVFVQISPACGNFRLPMLASATVTRESFNAKFTANIDVLIGYFMLYTIADADIGSLKFFHTFLDSICTTCWCNLNKVVWSKLHKILSFLTESGSILTKRWHYFGRLFCSWNNCLMLKIIDLKITIFHYSKHYGSPAF